MLEDATISYQASMLPGVDYSRIEDDDLSLSLVDLEAGTLQSYRYFLERLKPALIAEKLVQTPELLVSHLCAYLAARYPTCDQAPFVKIMD